PPSRRTSTATGPRAAGARRPAGAARASVGAYDAEVAADGLAAHDENRPVAGRARLAPERHLRREVARDRAGVDVEARARRDPDLDVARDALRRHLALTHA